MSSGRDILAVSAVLAVLAVLTVGRRWGDGEVDSCWW